MIIVIVIIIITIIIIKITTTIIIINKIQKYDPYHIKNEEVSGNISQFPTMQ